MLKGFDVINLNLSDYSAYYEKGQTVHASNKSHVEKSLDAIINDDGSIYSSKLSEDWFPQIDAEVFISHSHKDSKLAISLAGWLQTNFGLTGFIDSSVWGYSEQLLKKLDDKYCLHSDRKTYDYDKRNKTTSHVNMLLSTALTSMIDRCECVIFLNTPQSISCEGYKTQDATESPWIYFELAITKSIKKHFSPRGILKKAFEVRSMDESLKIKYDVDLDHLFKINKQALDNWAATRKKGWDSLDKLYEMPV